MRDHDALIDALSRSATPVRRPWPVLARAVLWSGVALTLGWLTTAGIRGPLAEWGADSGWGVAQLGLSLALGLVGLAAAFQTSIPGGRRSTVTVLAIGAVVWLGIGIVNVVVSGAPTGSPGDGLYCFGFLMAAGLPMIVLAITALRRAGSLTPRTTLTAAGVGIGGLSASLLALCHPFGLEAVDFTMHLVAVAVLVAATVGLGRPWIDWPNRNLGAVRPPPAR